MEAMKSYKGDNWSNFRINTFVYYTELIESAKGICTEKDRKFLYKIGRKATEPPFFRAKAWSALIPLNFFFINDPDEAVHCFDLFKEVFDSMGESEKLSSWKLMDVMSLSVGELLTQHQNKHASWIAKSEKGTLVAYAPDGSSRNVPILPGFHCDFCGIHREVLDMKRLSVCKEVCRKEGEFQFADLAITLEPFGRSQTHHVRILGVDPTDPDLLTVCSSDHYRILAVHPDDPGAVIAFQHWDLEGVETGVLRAQDLKRTRPALWDAAGVIDQQQSESAMVANANRGSGQISIERF